MGIPIGETSTLVTSGPFALSSEGCGTFNEMAAELGMNNGELLSVSCVGSSISAAVDASSGDPLGIIIFFKDTMPYSRTENRASHFYQYIQCAKKETEFPVVIAENEKALSAMQSVFGECDRSKMLETLDVLEKIIVG